LKQEALDRIKRRNSFGRGFGPVVWQITDDDDDDEGRLKVSTLFIMNLYLAGCIVLLNWFTA
jgi:hypothetical protein